MAEKGKNVSETLQDAYPPAAKPDPTPVVDEGLKQKLADAEAKALELQKQNDELSKKLADMEHEKLVALAEKVADLKVSKGLLKEEGKEAEVEKLSKMSKDTLEVLDTELSAIKVTLTEEDPQPSSTPAPEPTQLTDDQKREQEIADARMKMFGHSDDPYEFYKKQAGRQ